MGSRQDRDVRTFRGARQNLDSSGTGGGSEWDAASDPGRSCSPNRLPRRREARGAVDGQGADSLLRSLTAQPSKPVAAALFRARATALALWLRSDEYAREPGRFP